MVFALFFALLFPKCMLYSACAMKGNAQMFVLKRAAVWCKAADDVLAARPGAFRFSRRLHPISCTQGACFQASRVVPRNIRFVFAKRRDGTFFFTELGGSSHESCTL